ncbi:MAG: hypothetical protein OEW18_03610 [Candidatus Aminicenantes bacterium]|nr:hypothetical protein [Candidatus Aminicenantes bacterium]
MRRKIVVLFVLAGLVALGTPLARAQSVDKVKEMMAFVNGQLQARGASVRLEVAEFITYSHQAGQTVYYNDRTHQLGAHWVPNDPRRYGVANIYWLSDQTEGTANGLTLGATQSAVDSAMNTWNTQNCAAIPLLQLPDYGYDWGYVQYLTGFGGIPGWYADVTQAGWLPGAFFEYIGGPGGSDYILGVTYTFVWVSGGQPTDIDNNKKLDVAFREIYYNNKFPWGIGTSWPIDVETIVLHETGHGLSLGHFGKLFVTDANGRWHFAPLAVMNAGYTQIQHDLKGTDLASFCSIWARWPLR